MTTGRTRAQGLMTCLALAWSAPAAAADTDLAARQAMDHASRMEQGSEPEDKASFVVLPIPQSNPALGNGLVLAGVAFYQPEGSPRPWITGAAVLHTDNGSRGGGVFQKAYLKGDRYRVTAFAVGAELNVKFYGIGAHEGTRDLSVPIEQSARAVQLDGLRRLRENLYAGIRLRTGRVKTSLRFEGDPATGFDLDALTLDTRIGGPGLLLQYDSRDSETFPRNGTFASLQLQWSLESFGSDLHYDRQELGYNRYRSLGTDSVLALRASMCRAGDDAPFFDICLFGAFNDLRGYETGQYRDRAMAAAQAEYRWNFARRWGAVFFAGVGSVAPSVGELAGSQALPSGGVGLRFKASTAYNVNISLDYAVGRDTEAVYLYIGESF
jgi:outer membrane protein assembly factor BamA